MHAFVLSLFLARADGGVPTACQVGPVRDYRIVP